MTVNRICNHHLYIQTRGFFLGGGVCGVSPFFSQDDGWGGGLFFRAETSWGHSPCVCQQAELTWCLECR